MQSFFFRRLARRGRRLGRAGFSLIDVVMTLAVISAVFVVFQAAFGNILLNRRVEREEVALRIANTEMERIRSLSYDTVPVSGVFNSPLLAQLPQALVGREVSDYDPATKQVTVSVSWQEQTSPTRREVSLTTLVTKGGL